MREGEVRESYFFALWGGILAGVGEVTELYLFLLSTGHFYLRSSGVSCLLFKI